MEFDPRYQIVLTPDISGGWFAYVPQCPGCVSHGETAEGALVMIHDALSGWLEGLAEMEGGAVPLECPVGDQSDAGAKAYADGHKLAANPWLACLPDEGGAVPAAGVQWRAGWGRAYAQDGP